jgi:predicted DNA-binding antitoxin AbrB/MazE fold protein
MMPQMIRITAVYENGVLKPEGGRVPNLIEGDRVEAVLVRFAPIDADAPEEVARRERAVKGFEDRVRQLESQAPEEDGDGYDVLEAMNATRLRQGERPLIPPAEAK